MNNETARVWLNDYPPNWFFISFAALCFQLFSLPGWIQSHKCALPLCNYFKFSTAVFLFLLIHILFLLIHINLIWKSIPLEFNSCVELYLQAPDSRSELLSCVITSCLNFKSPAFVYYYLFAFLYAYFMYIWASFDLLRHFAIKCSLCTDPLPADRGCFISKKTSHRMNRN